MFQRNGFGVTIWNSMFITVEGDLSSSTVVRINYSLTFCLPFSNALAGFTLHGNYFCALPFHLQERHTTETMHDDSIIIQYDQYWSYWIIIESSFIRNSLSTFVHYRHYPLSSTIFTAFRSRGLSDDGSIVINLRSHRIFIGYWPMLWVQIHYNYIVEDTNSIQCAYPVGGYPGNFVQKLKQAYEYTRYIYVFGNASLNRDCTDTSLTIARNVCFLFEFFRPDDDRSATVYHCIMNDDKIVT